MNIPEWDVKIPKNYYCNFKLDLNRNYIYTIQVDRFLSHSSEVKLYENIEFQVMGGSKEQKDLIYVSNQDLRKTLHQDQSQCVPL